MPYRTLEKLFYMDTSAERFTKHDQLAQERLEASSTFRTGVSLAYGELFLAVPRELSVLTEQVLRRERKVSSLWRALPPVALGAYVRGLIMDEVVYSNEIEGVHSTRRQIEIALEAAARDTRRLKGAAEKEHAPFAEFARLYLNLLDNPEPPTSLEGIRRAYDAVVHGALDKADAPDGALFRSGPVVIESNRGKLLHTGVYPEEKICAMLAQMLALSTSEDVPQLYRALLCHFLFEHIHPFYDGNGRTGRYLLALHLSEPLSQPTVLSLSRVIAENKNAYYKAFDTVEKRLNCAEATPFVMTMLELIGAAQDELIADLSEKQSRLAVMRRGIEDVGEKLGAAGPLTAREKEALFYTAQMHVFDAFGETRAHAAAEHLGVTAQTVRRIFVGLEQKGLVERVSRRPAVYRLSPTAAHLLSLDQ